ncbi:MAG: LCP family protein [Candidatus Fervidibacter sp.]|uniref:LCP family protein n=1 Tax=Candidatus Fervidibacter sp. TaxID=3100871 RepID=UPI00404A810D
MIPKHSLSYRQRKLRRRGWRQILLTIAAVLVSMLSAMVGVSVYLNRHGQKSIPVRIAEGVVNWFIPPDYAFNGRDRLNILVIGADYNYDNKARPLPRPARSDTILIVSLGRDGSAAILSIPRDTVVRFNGKLHKINAAHAIGGPELLAQVIEEQFGIRIHHFVQITYEAFVKLVDLVGGVDLFVEYDMHYDDNWGNLHIHIQRGFHHLDGKQALGFVRYRGKGYKKFCPKCKVKIERWDPRGDLGRVERQQQFLKALAKKLLQPKTVVMLPKLAFIAHNYVATSMDAKTLLSLVNFARQLNLDNIKTATLPGTGARSSFLGSIIVPDKEEGPKVLSELLGSTFVVSLWEQGAGAIGGSIRLASGAGRSKKQRIVRQQVDEEEPTDVQTIEGVPLTQEPIEVTPIEPIVPQPPLSPTLPETSTETAKPKSEGTLPLTSGQSGQTERQKTNEPAPQ